MSLSIFEAADHEPDRLAVISATERLTFSALADRAAALIGGLRAAGLDGTASLPRAAVIGTNSMETVCFIAALIEMGEPFVLLHPRLTERERGAILDEVRPQIVLDRDRYASLLRAPERTAHRIPDERCLALMYTSGTSGRAKGALLSRRAFMASARASEQNLGWLDADRWLACIPLAHVGALSVVTRCLIARRTVVLEEAAVERLMATIEREQVTIASLVPTVLRRLFDADPSWSPSSLRAVLLGGAGAPASLLEEAQHRGIPVLTTYGLTEACSQVTTQRYGTPPSVEQGAGEPLAGFQIRIQAEQILVKSPSLMSGYFGAHRDPFLSDGFFPTQDMGRLDEHGRLHVLARRSDLIVTGGENVYPTEVEQALLDIPGIEAACVFGLPDETWGEIVSAALIAAHPPPDVEIARHVSVALASFKWPRKIAFLDAMPLTTSDKIDRVSVRRHAELALRPFDVRGLSQ